MLREHSRESGTCEMRWWSARRRQDMKLE